MEGGLSQDANLEIQSQLIILAAAHHNIESLRTLLRTGSASSQDPETGCTPLHAAIAACEDDTKSTAEAQNSSIAAPTPNRHTNGKTSGEGANYTESNPDGAAQTMKLLLQNGAIWNDVDNNNETPGCLALRLGLTELYEIMVDAGVRAEMLLNRLDEYQQLADDGESEEATEVDTGVDDVNEQKDVVSDQGGVNDHSGPNLIKKNAKTIDSEGLRNEEFLQSQLHFQNDRLLDDSNNGVMMAWETDIMKRTAELLAPKRHLRILNIGHGMGIIDTFFEETKPRSHHIIEAHPAVLARMKKDGWYEKPNTTIHEGRWQDVVPSIIEKGKLFDAIYFDTFAEEYKALRDFFSDCIIGLLDDGGKWGFFNGLGADRKICYDVYGKIVEMDLFEAGFDTNWERIEVPRMEHAVWAGVTRKYWTLDQYVLPVCEFIG